MTAEALMLGCDLLLGASCACRHGGVCGKTNCAEAMYHGTWCRFSAMYLLRATAVLPAAMLPTIVGREHLQTHIAYLEQFVQPGKC
jgi:hypothetical protein